MPDTNKYTFSHKVGIKYYQSVCSEVITENKKRNVSENRSDFCQKFQNRTKHLHLSASRGQNDVLAFTPGNAKSAINVPISDTQWHHIHPSATDLKKTPFPQSFVVSRWARTLSRAGLAPAYELWRLVRQFGGKRAPPWVAAVTPAHSASVALPPVVTF